jgi:choloylglycine hydrolase
MRKINILCKLQIIIVSLAFFTTSVITQACTGIVLAGKDGTIVVARTLEWGHFDMHSNLEIVPRGYKFSGLTPNNKPMAQWDTKYGFVGMDVMKKDLIASGLNEKGLYVGTFYLPGFASYEDYSPKTAARALSASELNQYLLAQCSSINDVRKALGSIKVVSVVEPDLGIPAPLHWLVVDPSGKSIVIEIVNKGEVKIYDNPVGAITNAPTFDWHLTNLRNYLFLTTKPNRTIKLHGLTLSPFGVGSGMLGLPGDVTPPSRFVRAVTYVRTARTTAGGLDTVNETFRILDNFNLALNSSDGGPQPGNTENQMVSATEWTTAADLKNLVFYYHTAWNRRIREVNLRTIDFGKVQFQRIPADKVREQDIVDITPNNAK